MKRSTLRLSTGGSGYIHNVAEFPFQWNRFRPACARRVEDRIGRTPARRRSFCHFICLPALGGAPALYSLAQPCQQKILACIVVTLSSSETRMDID